MNRDRWSYKKLGEVAKIINGKNQKAVEDSNGQYPICGSGGIMGYATDYLCPENCVIIGRKGNINRPLFMTQKFWNVDTAFGIKANEVDIVPKFLFYFCQYFDFQKLNKAVTIPSLVKSDLLKIDLPVPSIKCQGNIISELDSLNDSIAMLQQQVKDLDALAQSIYYNMFGDPIENPKGWEVSTLKDVSKEKLSYGSGASAVKYDGKVRYIRITDIDDLGNLNDNIVSPSIFEDKYILKEGDILFARSGATVGKTYCHNTRYGKCIYAGYLIRLVPNQNIVLPSYVFGYTKTAYYKAFVENAQRAVAQPNINAKQYGDLKICVPPLNLQKIFESKIMSIEDSKILLNAQISEMKNLLASRMQYWFD